MKQFIKNFGYTFIGITLILLPAYLLRSLSRPSVKGMAYKQVTHKFKSLQLFSGQVKNFIYEVGILHPEIAYKQAKYETGHFNKQTSGMRNNNLFCFQQNDSVMKFDNWQESVYYYKFRQKYHFPYKSGNYYEYLKKTWKAPNMENYIQTLQNIY